MRTESLTDNSRLRSLASSLVVFKYHSLAHRVRAVLCMGAGGGEESCINIITLGNYGNDVHPIEEQEVDINNINTPYRQS